MHSAAPPQTWFVTDSRQGQISTSMPLRDGSLVFDDQRVQVVADRVAAVASLVVGKTQSGLDDGVNGDKPHIDRCAARGNAPETAGVRAGRRKR